MKTQGFKCDECERFITGDTIPVGWIVIKPVLLPGINGEQNSMDVCSNLCLANLAVERAAADGTPFKVKRNFSDPSGKQAAHRYQSPESLAASQLYFTS